MTLPRTRFALALLLLLGSTLPAAEPSVTFDRWYVMLLENQPAGWTHAWVTQAGQVITTHEEAQITVKRGAVELTIHTRSAFDETLDGKPMAARTSQKLGAMQVDSTMTFGDKLIEVVTTQGQQSQTQTFPLPREPWLPPAAAQRHFEQQMAQGKQRMSLWTLTPAMGPRAVKMDVEVAGPANVEVMGKTVPAILWNTTMSAMPGMVIKSYVDEQGQMVKTTTALMPGMELTVLQADEALARKQVSAPEMMVNTLVPVQRGIASPRTLRRGVYELTFKPAEGDGKATLPQTPVQQVNWQGDLQATVTIDLDKSAAVEPGPVDERYRKASAMLNSDDPRVRQLLTQALGDSGKLSDAEKAERLRQFVLGYIDAKDLSVGLATASEVARTAQGDCTEHAMLLAALLRAADIPSRTVTGLVYVDGFLGQRQIFGYHMWTQAWLSSDGGERWVDLDATLDQAQPFDATHIALSTSAQDGEGLTNDVIAILPVLGRLTIRVVEP